MDYKMIFGDSGILLNILTLAALIVIIIMLFITKRSITKDHERRKKQATIEYFNRTSNNTSGPLRIAMSEALNESLIEFSHRTSLPDESIWKENQELQIALLRYLRYMERFSVGIKLKIFDFETFYYAAGKETLELYLLIKNVLNTIGPIKNKFCPEYKLLYQEILVRYYSNNLKKKNILT